jgi:uncharacterized protein YbjQ (UPF0145 family)
MPVMSGLSGNEMYCLARKGLRPGDLVVGNSVFSLGVVGGLTSGLKVLAGGEVTDVTSLIHEGRVSSYQRMRAEAERRGGLGITGVSNELLLVNGNVEFLSIGSGVHAEQGSDSLAFSTAADGQELYCQLDCGFEPRQFVFGNVAYSIGVGGNLMGGLRSLGRGEVKEYSDVFNTTRHLALQRIQQEARNVGANAVVGINTTIMPFMGMQEMLMIGTASYHPLLQGYAQEPVTSGLSNQEMWNLAALGYLPVGLVLGVSVYSLGVMGGLSSALKSLVRGEISELTHMVYEARKNAIDKLAHHAAAVGAEDVVGIKTYVYQLGSGMLEFLALGTGIRRFEGARTLSDTLPPQAIIRDSDTFVNTAEASLGLQLNAGLKAAR